jgi:hemerythrin
MDLALPQVSVASMNATHEEELTLLRELANILAEAEPDEERLGAAVSAFRDHVEQHFSREEGLMEAYGFPPYPIHKSEHDRMRRIVSEYCANWNSAEGRAALQRFVTQEFPDWLSQHVQTMDMVTAQFLAMHGVE